MMESPDVVLRAQSVSDGEEGLTDPDTGFPKRKKCVAIRS